MDKSEQEKLAYWFWEHDGKKENQDLFYWLWAESFLKWRTSFLENKSDDTKGGYSVDPNEPPNEPYDTF